MVEVAEIVNPLREGLTQERKPEPCALVILGAHGDLTKRKLVPAIYALYLEGNLPEDYCIVGLSRTVMTHEQFRASMKDSIQKFASDLPFEETKWAQFEERLYYQPGNFGQKSDFEKLNVLLKELAEKHNTLGNNVFYLSTPPSLYAETVRLMAEAGLAEAKPGKLAPWPRLVVEKPFGHDIDSARSLNKEIHQYYTETQVYRIDHYLGKETVQNIMVLRFANGIFEPLWNRDHISHVQITNAETLGVEGRIAYYEEAGALRDMVQNHMFALLSLVAMEPPISLDADATRDERTKVLKSIKPVTADEVANFAVRGQYGPGWINGQPVPGYREEPGVKPDSKIETFAALKFSIDNWRWAGVPFYVRTGKRLRRGTTEIAINFRRAPQNLFQQPLLQAQMPDYFDRGPNVLVMQIQPDEGISLKFATKQPGTTTQVRWLSMDFRYGAAFGVRSPSAYERLLHDCLLGDASLFARTDAVETAWELLDPILDVWSDSKADFPNYEAGSWGPQASDKLIQSTGDAWRSL